MERTNATIQGSHGTLHINPITGLVMEITNNEGELVNYYGEIQEYSPVLVDLIEWRKGYPDKELRTDMNYDILDFGYIMENGKYEPPCHDWRKEMAKAAEDEDYLPFSGPTEEQNAPRVAIIMDGGIVQNVLASKHMDIVIIDYDTDGADPNDLTEIFPETFGFFQTFEPELNSPDLDALSKVESGQRIPKSEEIERCKECRFF